MTREEFDKLVHRVEARYAGRPGALRLRIAFLAALGYASFAAWFGFALFFSALFLVPAILMPLQNALPLMIIGSVILAVGLIGVVRVLWVRVSPPKGRLLSRAEAPALFAMLDELRSVLRSAPFHRVLVIRACNAGVNEVARLGVFGWPRNYLQLGLPVLEVLAPGELRAVLAHEAAHLSGRHGRFSSWIYRLRRSWEAVFAELNRPRTARSISMRPVLLKFFNWFWPRFNAHAFVLSRANEFEADAVAAQLGGTEASGLALRRIELCSRFLDEKFWPDLWQSANRSAEPPPNVFDRLRTALETGGSPEQTARWSAEALRIATNTSDTHPCLTERLTALHAAIPVGEPLVPALPAAPSAATALLGAALDSVRADVDRDWREDCAKNWRDRHARAQALNDRLENLARVLPHPSATPEALWDRARALIDLEGDAAAEGLLRELLVLRPEHATANFCLGRFLLGKGDPAGEALLERAMLENEEMVPQACGLLHVHFQRSGDAPRLAELRARMDRYEGSLAASRDERSNVSVGDRFLPHGLIDEELAPVRALLAAESSVASAELIQKELKHFVRQRLFVLCIRAVRPWHGLRNEALERALVQRLIPKIKLPGRMLIFAPAGDFRPLARRMSTLPGATIYRRQAS